MIILAVAGIVATILLVPRGPSARRTAPVLSPPRVWHRFALGAVPALMGGRAPARAEAAAVPELLELTARSRRAGMALVPSLTAASDMVPDAGVGPALARLAAGSSLADALDEWAAAIDDGDAELAVAVLLLGDASGAAVAGRLDRSAAMLRQRAALADEVRALTAQTRASAMVVALAPLGFAVVVAMTDSGFVETMIGTPIGRISLVAGLLLDAIGVWWMSRLTRSDRW